MRDLVEIALVAGPLPRAEPWGVPGAGAVVVFEGIVRPSENDRPLAALVYEAYEPMTTRELRRLAERIAAEFGLLAVRVEHSVGRVAAGETSFRLLVAGGHRREAIDATDSFIAAMKAGVPLWKVAEFA